MPKVWSLQSRWIRATLGLAIGVVFFALALRQASWSQVQDILRHTDSRWIAVAIATYGISMVIRVERWRLLLWDVKPLAFKVVGLALVIGYAMNNILPARLGELVRANFASRRYALPLSATLGSIALERTLDGLIVVLSLLAGRFFVMQSPLLNSLTIAGFALFVGIAIALWVVSARTSSRWLDRLPKVVSARIRGFQAGLSALRGTQLSRVALFSLLVWVLEAIAHWSVLQALQLSLSWTPMLLIVGVVNLSTLIPSAPGFAGTYQYAYAFVLGLFGYTPASGIAAATAVQIFLLGSTTLIGLGLYIGLHLRSVVAPRPFSQIVDAHALGELEKRGREPTAEPKQPRQSQ